LLHLLRCNGQDGQDFDHDIHEDFQQFNGRRTFNINLKAFEEVLDASKEIGERIVTGFDTLCRLWKFRIEGSPKSNWEDTDRKENTDTSKDHFRRWKRLHNKVRITTKISFLIDTRLIPPPRVSEIEESTFTDDPIRFINL
jgi:hypothetical protein